MKQQTEKPTTKVKLMSQEETLRKKCPDLELFWSIFFYIRTERGDIPGDNSEYRHFLRSEIHNMNFSNTT